MRLQVKICINFSDSSVKKRPVGRESVKDPPFFGVKKSPIFGAFLSLESYSRTYKTLFFHYAHLFFGAHFIFSSIYSIFDDFGQKTSFLAKNGGFLMNFDHFSSKNKLFTWLHKSISLYLIILEQNMTSENPFFDPQNFDISKWVSLI